MSFLFVGIFFSLFKSAGFSREKERSRRFVHACVTFSILRSNFSLIILG